MAKIIGGVTSSHIPAVGNAIANNLQQEPYWKRFFDGYEPAKAWLQQHKPDVAIVVYNDHGLNFSSTRCQPSRWAAPTSTRMPTKAGR